MEYRKSDVDGVLEETRVEPVVAFEAHHVVGAVRRLCQHPPRRVGVGPQPMAVDCHRHDFVFLAIEGAVDRSRRYDAHIMLVGASTEDEGYTLLCRIWRVGHP
jgi:hypothetical protein